MPIQVMCGSCAKRFKAGEKLAGKKVKCPECQGVIEIPASRPVRVDQPAPTPKPAHAAQPAPAAQVANAAAAPPMAGAGIGGLLDQEDVPTQRRCSACGSPLGATDVLCVSCGYDTRSGTQVPKKVDEPKKTPRRRKKAAAAGQATGAFIRGCLISGVFAFMAAGVWYGVAIGTGFEIGWIAWGLGLAAGAGMQLGYGSTDGVAGITAAVIACLGIMAAKWMIFCHFAAQAAEMLGVAAGEITSHGELFFQTCFGFIDIIFFLLAIGTAYKVGAGISTE